MKSEKKKHKDLNPPSAFGNVPLHPHLHVAGTPPCGNGGCGGPTLKGFCKSWGGGFLWMFHDVSGCFAACCCGDSKIYMFVDLLAAAF